MKPKTDFKAYIENTGTLPPDCVLGHIAWFTVEDGSYDADRLAKDFDRLGLNPDLLPPKLRTDDAFEKATREVDKFRYTVMNNLTAEILVREVGRDARTITRHLIREVKDDQGQRLLYERVGQFVFYKPTDKVGKVDQSAARIRATLDESVSATEREILAPVIAQFEASFHRHRDFHDGQKIRGVLRGYLTYLNAVQMKPSVYFCHASRSEELERLKEFADGLGTASMLLLPQADLPRLRQDVLDAFQAEAEKELIAVVTEIAKLRATRKNGIRPEAYAKIKGDYDRVIAKATEYSRTLQMDQDRTAGAANLAIDSLMALQQDVMKGPA